MKKIEIHVENFNQKNKKKIQKTSTLILKSKTI